MPLKISPGLRLQIIDVLRLREYEILYIASMFAVGEPTIEKIAQQENLWVAGRTWRRKKEINA